MILLLIFKETLAIIRSQHKDDYLIISYIAAAKMPKQCIPKQNEVIYRQDKPNGHFILLAHNQWI